MQISPTTLDRAKEIGVRVRETRKGLGLRQDELAIAAGVSTRAIHQIEHGKPTSRFDILSRVLEVLGLGLAVAERSGRHRPGDEKTQ